MIIFLSFIDAKVIIFKEKDKPNRKKYVPLQLKRFK